MPAFLRMISVLVLMMPAGARAESLNDNAAAIYRNEARWAEWEAQARITDGDYDGAVQAEQTARAEWRRADREDMAAGARPR